MSEVVPPRPKRRFFQIHLSTAIVMMVVAGILVWLNVTGRVELPDMLTNEPVTYYGWPTNCVTVWTAFAMRSTQDVPEIFTKLIWTNVGVALSILFNVYGVCEWVIGWRAGRAKR